MVPDTGECIAAILNAAWMVRHYSRGARSQIQRAERKRAIYELGLVCRTAFNSTDDFEPIFQAIVDGLIPKEEPRF